MVSAQSGIDLRVRVPISTHKEGKWFVAECTTFKIASQGRTRELAIRNTENAIRVLIAAHYQRGTLMEMANDSGLTSSAGEMTSKEMASKEIVHTEVSGDTVISEFSLPIAGSVAVA